MSKLVCFMRAENLVGRRYSFQISTPTLEYKNKEYFSFIASDEAAEWVKEQSLTKNCYLLPDSLRNVLEVNEVYFNGFVDDIESEQVLDVSDKALEAVTLIVDCTELKEEVFND